MISVRAILQVIEGTKRSQPKDFVLTDDFSLL